ncbi:aldose epimerase family protein [Mucilaginibacter boryungensis]|uniref:Aldose 1-epimerase n=1 Tax=Mucilaginibacter boryungensis TaxID=768480 RepID=A0ABR9XFK0_9SPHI|nr:aldose epimerase family protein [Mucilaginibacter boryungensis]MBE9665803.1 galactose mutarotase [Mucilaginibacter boryungensis]
MKLTKKLWGRHEGKDVYLFHLSNDKMEISVSNFGATITSIFVPDKNGSRDNIVLNYPDLSGYVNDNYYMGCTVGRFAGRIANARVEINEVVYPLAANDGGKNIHLHGGNKGFNKQVFDVASEKTTDDTASVTFNYRSPHLEEGYPGNLDVWVTFELTIDNYLNIRYQCLTDRDTHVNLTNHCYFNLSGNTKSALTHKLFINGDKYVVTDNNYIPTGELKPVTNTPYDFRNPHTIADSKPNGYYNECYVLNVDTGKPAAILSDDTTGRQVIVETDMPGLLFYSGDYLGGQFSKNSGLCLETQFFPDTPNHRDFPGSLLKAGEQWESCTQFTFKWVDVPLT